MSSLREFEPVGQTILACHWNRDTSAESLEASGGFGSPTSIQTLVYGLLLQCVLDAIHNLEIGHKARVFRDDEDMFQSNEQVENDESLVVAAEMGSGLRAVNPDDMQAFAVLSGELFEDTQGLFNRIALIWGGIQILALVATDSL